MDQTKQLMYKRELDIFNEIKPNNFYTNEYRNPETIKLIKEYRKMKYIPTPKGYTKYVESKYPEKDAENISDMIERMKNVNETYFGDWDYSWLEQICLVGLGKKNVANTTFDTTDDPWLFNYKSAFAMLKYFKDLNFITFPEHPHTIYNEIGGQIWYRNDTKYLALCLLRLFELSWEGYSLPGVYYHIVQGICYGYSKEKISEWVKNNHKHDMSDNEYQTSLQYVTSFKN